MSNKKYFYALLLVFCCLISQLSAQQDTLKVLFVGNSYTYFWNLPQTVEAMSSSKKGVYIMARQSTAGGATWKQHWNGEKELKSRELILNGKWDVVVLQNHSKSTINNIDQFFDYGEKFISLVKESGAKPILYMTWAREYNPLMQSTIKKGYNDLAKKNGVEVVPVGNMWEKARQLRPDLKLFDPDGSHPSPIGTYLTACAFFTYLLDQSPLEIPQRVTSVDANEQPLYLSIMSEANAEFLQSVVDDFYKNMKEEK